MPVKFLSEDFSEAATSSHSERYRREMDVTTTTHEEDDKGESLGISLRTFTVKKQWGRGSNKEVQGQGRSQSHKQDEDRQYNAK